MKRASLATEAGLSAVYVVGLTAALIFSTAAAAAQGTATQGNAGLVGSWRLDTSKVESTVRAAGPGRAGGPPATNIAIAIAPTEVSVSSDTGTNRAMETAVYKIGSTEHKVPGPLSWTTLARGAWDGDRLVVNIARIIEGPNGDVRIEMKDVYSVAGGVLTLVRSQGPDSWTSVYLKGS
jgi:hypothetical protein